MKLTEPLKVGIIGGVLGFAISATLNYFIFPVPLNSVDNAIGNGMSGLMTGLMTGFVGLTMYMKNSRKIAEQGIVKGEIDHE
ncbi:hypothetical protein ACT9XH_00615 [Methanococcoides methylutens]|uniref:hypothetical protein n=1 Tax=Methanococcoides methylutens TaxID=2226 RepID=UPI00404425A4